MWHPPPCHSAAYIKKIFHHRQLDHQSSIFSKTAVIQTYVTQMKKNIEIENWSDSFIKQEKHYHPPNSLPGVPECTSVAEKAGGKGK